MKAVILAGGFGTRLSEETSSRPKPMVEIGGYPILWHIMKIYQQHGIDDFVICCGYRGYMIKEYFANYALHMSDVTFDMRNDKLIFHNRRAEPWCVTLVDTGEASLTGGRLGRVRRFLQDEESFCLTYGDGVGDVDITASIAFHKSHGALATMTATRPAGRFGHIDLSGPDVRSFQEKKDNEDAFVNGGFFVLSNGVFDYIDGDDTIWESHSLPRLARDGMLKAFRHTGFWYPMDTLRDRNHLEALWASGEAPWRIWDEG